MSDSPDLVEVTVRIKSRLLRHESISDQLRDEDALAILVGRQAIAVARQKLSKQGENDNGR